LMALKISSSPALGGAISIVAAGAAALITIAREVRWAACRLCTSLAPLKEDRVAPFLHEMGQGATALLMTVGMVANCKIQIPSAPSVSETQRSYLFPVWCTGAFYPS
jgi:hypothetical protein